MGPIHLFGTSVSGCRVCSEIHVQAPASMHMLCFRAGQKITNSRIRSEVKIFSQNTLQQHIHYHSFTVSARQIRGLHFTHAQTCLSLAAPGIHEFVGGDSLCEGRGLCQDFENIKTVLGYVAGFERTWAYKNKDISLDKSRTVFTFLNKTGFVRLFIFSFLIV